MIDFLVRVAVITVAVWLAWNYLRASGGDTPGFCPHCGKELG